MGPSIVEGLALVNIAVHVTIYRGSCYLKPDRHDLCAHTKTTRGLVTDVAPFHLKDGSQFGLLYCFCSHDNLSSILGCRSKRQIASEYLTFGPHECSHGRLYTSNGIKVSLSVPIYHLEPQTLLFLKEVIDSEACVEIRIQVVLNLFCLTKLNPLLGLIIVLAEDAYWVRLG